MLTPKPLFPGARVALVCASSAVPAERLAPAEAAVRALGLEPVLYPSCYFENRHGYFAAADAQRAAHINAAFADDSIDGILSIRGGYGAHRILPLLDWDVIRAHPKYFSGYSDVTALHTAFNQTCGFVTYHTIMPSTEYYQEVGEYSMGWLKKALFGELTGPLTNPADQPMHTLVGGKAEGTLCGGNLSLLAASLGTPWEIDTRGKILFLEDIGEKTYRVDSMLTQLRNAGKFADCAGVILGAWTDCPPEYPERTLLLPEIFAELIAPAGKPTITDLACGHVIPTLSLPLGARVSMDADACTLTVL
jgi:muramoyltetrapeptide carboxypeptidase